MLKYSFQEDGVYISKPQHEKLKDTLHITRIVLLELKQQ